MSHAVQLQKAADAVLVLINSTPRTPTRAEVAAVIGKALAAPSAARDTYRASAWHRALEDYLVASLTATTDDALDRLEDVTEAICAGQRARSTTSSCARRSRGTGAGVNSTEITCLPPSCAVCSS